MGLGGVTSESETRHGDAQGLAHRHPVKEACTETCGIFSIGQRRGDTMHKSDEWSMHSDVRVGCAEMGGVVRWRPCSMSPNR